MGIVTNGILMDKTFDPNKVHSPLQKEMSTPTNYNPTDTKFGMTRPLVINVPFHFAKADEYIDDIITVVLDTGN